MSLSRLHFPDEKTMTQYLSNHPLLNNEYYQEMGLTSVITQLATERFANSERVEEGVELGAQLIVYDLQQCKNGFTRKPIPNLSRLELPPFMWTQMSINVKAALLDCAKGSTTAPVEETGAAAAAAAAPLSEIQVGPIQEVAGWTGKKFGDLRGVRVVAEGIRILSHTGGFAVFLPPKIWRELDFQVPISFPENNEASCWIADKNFVFLKIDTIASELEGSTRDYISDDLEVALNKIESFVNENFFEDRRARPDSNYFTHGSFEDYPDMPRPIRFRLGGNFYYRF